MRISIIIKLGRIFLCIIFMVATILFPIISVSANSTPGASLVDTDFDTEEVVVADIILQSPEYEVDPTGVKDSTDAIKLALEDCFNSGGGTVFLPSGKYRVTDNLIILPFTALRGDYNDPDSLDFNGDYGTIIYADVSESEENFPAVFTVGGSSAVIGITIYYPNQDISNVKPYPYTFEIPSFASNNGHADHMASTIRNVTMLNSYKGICASITPKGSLVSAANEMIHLENIKGTVLFKGVELYNSSEYGVVRRITFDNTYWANAASYMTHPLKEEIDIFTSKHSIGMILGDLEWVQFTDILIADYKIGIRIFDGLRKYIPGQPEIYFIGQFYNLQITNTTTALRIDNMFPNFGITIAESTLQGSLFSIRNMDQTNSLIKLISTDLNGNTNGIRIQKSGGEATFEILKTDGGLPKTDFPVPVIPPKRIFNVATQYKADRTGNYDSTEAIQNALDAANAANGGIVYLPAGYYRVTGKLNVYANTELRGCAASAHRDEIGMSKGTILFANFGYTNDENTARTADALVNLTGDNAGIRGLRVIYPENQPNTDTGEIRFHSYTIRALADNNYIMNVSLVGVVYGIDFNGTSGSLLQNPIVRNVSGTYYRVGINMMNTSGGHIEEALSNATVVARHGLATIFPELFPTSWPSDSNGKLKNLYDRITRPNSIFIVLENCTDITIGNTFTYGSHTFIKAINSSVKIFNSAGDNLYPSGGKLFDITGGSLIGINIMRYSGIPLESSGSIINLFNRISLLENTDKDIVSGSLVAPSDVLGVIKSGDDLPDTYVYDPFLDPSDSSTVTTVNIYMIIAISAAGMLVLAVVVWYTVCKMRKRF